MSGSSVPLSYKDRPVLILDCHVRPDALTISLYDGVQLNAFTSGTEEVERLREILTNRKLQVVGFEIASRGILLVKFLLNKPTASSVEVWNFWDQTRGEINQASSDFATKRELLDTARRFPDQWGSTIDLHALLGGEQDFHYWQIKEGIGRIIPEPAEVSGVDPDRANAYLLDRSRFMVQLFERCLPIIDLRWSLRARYHSSEPWYFTTNEAGCASRMITNACGDPKDYVPDKEQRAQNYQGSKPHPLYLHKEFPLGAVIATDVRFRTDDLAAMLTELKESLVSVDDSGDRSTCAFDASIAEKVWRFGGLTFSISKGGLHSKSRPLELQADEKQAIIDLDFSGYYPAIIIKNGIIPRQLRKSVTDNQAELPVFPAIYSAKEPNDTFSTFIRPLNRERLAAKNKGDRIVADSLKIIINAIYGNFSVAKSRLCDHLAALSVTTNGQLYLLMLIEELVDVGCTIHAANTDGVLVTVPRDRLDSLTALTKRWSSFMGTTLERAEYQRYWSRHNNDYLALMTDGTVKARGGSLNIESSSAQAHVITRAAIAHLTNGVPCDATVRSETDPTAFLFHHAAGQRGATIVDQTGRTPCDRWYLAESGKDLEIPGKGVIRNDAQSIDDLSGLRADQLPALNVELYAQMAEELALQYQVDASIDRAAREGQRLRDMGIVLAPRLSNGHGLAGVALDDVDRHEAEFGRYPGYAIVTGQRTKTLVLDIDRPDLVPPELLTLIPSDALVSWHGTASATDVLTGRHRGAVTFRYSGDDARIRSGSLVDTHGIEIAYGSKQQTVIGLHRTARDAYCTTGSILDAPSALITLLGRLLGAPPRASTSAPLEGASSGQPDDVSPQTDVPTLETLAHLLAACRQILGATWGRIEGNAYIEGRTPGKESDLRVYVNDHQVRLHTFHAHFDRDGHQAAIQSAYDALRMAAGQDRDAPPDLEPLDPNEVPPPLDDIECKDARSLAQVFARPDPILLITAPTGSGKTHQQCTLAIERHVAGDHTLLIVQDKEAMRQARIYLQRQWEAAGHPASDLKLQLVEAGNQVEGDAAAAQRSAQSSVHAKTLIVITHHHFASRKPLASAVYPVVRWLLEHDVAVVIDEFDLYVERQNHGLNLDGRYVHIGSQHAPWQTVSTCMTRGGIFKCKSCVKRSGIHLKACGTHTEAALNDKIPVGEFRLRRSDEFEIMPHQIPQVQSVHIPEMQMTISQLERDELAWQNRAWDTDPLLDRQAMESLDGYTYFSRHLQDLITCSHRPTMLEFAPVDPAQKPPQPVHGDPQDLAAQPNSTFTSESTAAFEFPYPTCGVRTLVLYDMAPLAAILAEAERVIAMTATMTSWAREFIKACAGQHPVTEVDIIDPDRRPISKVIMIGLQSGITLTDTLSGKEARFLGSDLGDDRKRSVLEHVGSALMARGVSPLVFFPTSKRARFAFEVIREEDWRLYDQGHWSLKAPSGAVSQERDAQITYSRSVLGIGANLKHFDVVILDGAITKPHHVYMPEKPDHLAYLLEQELDRTRIIQQNIGRILRSDDPNAIKHVFVSNVSPQQFDFLCKEVAKVCQLPIEAKLYRDEGVVALAALIESVEQGHLVGLHPSEPSISVDSGKQKPKGRKPRNPLTKMQQHEIKVAKLAAKRVGWSEVYRSLNIYRMEPDVRSALQALYESLEGSTAEAIAKEWLSLSFPERTLPPEEEQRLRILSSFRDVAVTSATEDPQVTTESSEQ